jgi:hypothetical protein
MIQKNYFFYDTEKFYFFMFLQYGNIFQKYFHIFHIFFLYFWGFFPARQR